MTELVKGVILIWMTRNWAVFSLIVTHMSCWRTMGVICLFPMTRTTREFGGFQATWKEHDVVQHWTMDLCSIVGASVLHPPDVCVKKLLRPNCQAVYHSYELGILFRS